MSRGSSMSSLSKRSSSKIDLIRQTIIKRKIQTTRQSKTISGTKGWRWRGSRRRRETSSKRYGSLKERKRWKLLSRRRLSSRGSESKQLSLMRWNAKRNQRFKSWESLSRNKNMTKVICFKKPSREPTISRLTRPLTVKASPPN